MASLYGPGYGAGRLFEAGTGGMLKGNLMNYERGQQATQNEQRTHQLDIAEKRLLQDSQIAEIKRRSDAFSGAFNAASKAPAGQRKQIYESTYKALMPDGTPPAVEFDERGADTKITLEDGSVLRGPDEYISQLSKLIAMYPEQAPQHVQAALKSGIVQYEKMKQKGGQEGQKPFAVSPGSSIYDPAKGGFTMTAPGKPGGEMKPGDQIKQLELQAWNDFLAGKATPEQIRMVGADRDPLIVEAARMVNNDINMMSMPIEKKVQQLQQIVEMLRANPQAQGGGNERVEVISPQGQHGTIPASQLQDALSQGYTQVK